MTHRESIMTLYVLSSTNSIPGKVLRILALSHAQGHRIFISAQSFAGYKSLFWDYRPSRTSKSIRIRQSRVVLLRQRILQ